MRHSNQIGIVWQVEISPLSKTVLNQRLTFRKVFLLERRPRNDRPKKEVGITNFESLLIYFFKFSARKVTVRFQESAASAAR
jgi:hypothetical protein